MVPVFSDISSSCSVSSKTFPLDTALALPALIVLKTLVNLLEQFLKSFQFCYFLFLNFFLKFEIYLVIPEVLLHFRRFNPKEVGLLSTGMIFYNHSSLVILVNDAKYINFYLTFQLPPAPSHWSSHCRYKPFIKPIKFYLFRYKCWLNYLSAI